MGNVVDKFLWSKIGVDDFGKMLDLAAYRHKLISGNLANSMTPGYAAKDIDFQKEMNEALGNGPVLKMETSNPMHISNAGPQDKIKVIEHDAESREELNGVDVDEEMTNMSVNQMRYTIGAHLVQRKMSFFRKVITGR